MVYPTPMALSLRSKIVFNTITKLKKYCKNNINMFFNKKNFDFDKHCL